MRHLLALFFLGLLLTSCSLFKEEEEKPKKRSTYVVGEVTSVHPDQNFVLFKRYGPGQLLTDGLLSARSLDGKRAADLQLSPEKLGRFYTADYSAEGQIPREGDVVILSKTPDDTESDYFATEKTEAETLDFKKLNSSSEPEILDSTASQRNR